MKKIKGTVSVRVLVDHKRDDNVDWKERSMYIAEGLINNLFCIKHSGSFRNISFSKKNL